MSRFRSIALTCAVLAAVGVNHAHAERKTVCTVTVNSPDERETFRRRLPGDGFEFVELVERGRPDWLASSCRKGVRCDVLIISGHFDGGTEFYTDRFDAREYLPVDEMERVACSDSCPGLFSQLKEVYLFGCNTLNTLPMRSASAEVGRALVRSGHSTADAERIARTLAARHGESNRDRMRHIFKDVPVIYGFSGKAPLGRYAGPVLERYFETGAATTIGTGRTSPTLLGLFAPVGMTAAAGMTDADPRSGFRQDACQFADDRLSPAQKVAFVHQILQRDMAEVRMFLDPVEKHMASLGASERASPGMADALDGIARDAKTRERFLEFARDADEPSVRVRMMSLARSLGWLSPADERAEFMRMIDERLGRNVADAVDVGLACTHNRNRDLTPELHRLTTTSVRVDSVTHAAVLACLGSAEAHARVLRALAVANDDDVAIAQLYLHHRPIADTNELREVTSGIARMRASDAQVRALDSLAGHRLADPESLDALARLFPVARTLQVQRAIAGILIRSDFQALPRVELVKTLRKHRLKSPDGTDAIDVLIRRLQAS